MSSITSETDFLHLDPHTLSDLEIFESSSGGKTLFEYCNLTCTSGGEKALERRLKHPWCHVDAIRATQRSLSFISLHRSAFKMLPTDYLTSRVSQYMHEPLPVITQTNPLDFSIAIVSLWVNEKHIIDSVRRGVRVTCGLIHAMQDLIKQPALATAKGELAPLIDEVKSLLAHPKWSNMPTMDNGGHTWKILRLDQVFRLHDKPVIDRLLEIIYEIDALIALADTTDQNGLTIPEVETGTLSAEASGLVHPFVPSAVDNPVKLNQTHRLLLLTGPNMAGKTTYLRAFAISFYLAHLGMGVPAAHFRFSPAESLFSSITLSDNLVSGISYFRAEALRMKAIALAVSQGRRVVAIMDEPFKGTNVKDALDASLAVIQRLSEREDCLFMCSSHLIELAEQLNTQAFIDYRYFDAKEEGEKLSFDYKLRHGVSKQRLGMRVLHEEGIFSLLDEEESHELLST